MTGRPHSYTPLAGHGALRQRGYKKNPEPLTGRLKREVESRTAIYRDILREVSETGKTVVLQEDVDYQQYTKSLAPYIKRLVGEFDPPVIVLVSEAKGTITIRREFR